MGDSMAYGAVWILVSSLIFSAGYYVGECNGRSMVDSDYAAAIDAISKTEIRDFKRDFMRERILQMELDSAVKLYRECEESRK